MTLAETLDIAEDKMAKAVSITRSEFGGVRTGRASPALIERLMIDYYGASTPLQTLASFSVPESRMLVVNVYDRNAVSSVEKAIRNSDLGLNPNTDGSLIRLNFPALTGERRKELVRLVRSKAEDGRIAIRSLRHNGRKDLDALQDDGEISEDEWYRAAKELQDLTDHHVELIDELLENKEHELLED